MSYTLVNIKIRWLWWWWFLVVVVGGYCGCSGRLFRGGRRKRNGKYIYIYCRVPIFGGSLTVNVSEPKPNKPNTMNLVEKRA